MKNAGMDPDVVEGHVRAANPRCVRAERRCSQH